MKNKIKRVLSMMTAIALVMTSVLTANVTNAYAASSSKAIKSVTLKIGSSNVTKKTKTLTVGSSATLKVTVKPSSAKKKVTYKSSKTSVATVSSKGKIVAKKAGTAKITVTVTGKNNKKKSTYCKIKVKNVAVTKVKLNASEKKLTVGDSARLKATVSPSNATVKTVKWASSNKAVATVNSKGVVKAISAGTTVVTATSGSKSAMCIVTVSNPVADKPVTGVTLNYEELEVAVSATAQLKATVVPSDAADKSVTWASDNTSVATVTNDGVVKGVTKGTANITVTTNDGKFVATCKVNVVEETPNNAAAVNINIANSLKDYANTVLTGTNADVKVLVTDAKGTPVGNTSVTLTIAAQYGNAPYAFGITGDNNNYVSAKLTTDEQGYASFTVGLRGGYNYTSTDLYYESYKLVATVTGSSVTTESALSFACIDLGDVEVLNNKSLLYNDLEPGENAPHWNGVAGTWSTNGARTEEYVDSQKVSTFNEDGTYLNDHRVYVTAAPYIVLPAKKSQTEIDKYYDAINESSDEYSVYNTEENEATTTVVKEVPAGLQYASLIFSKIELSKYTTLQIKTYSALTGACIETYIMDDTNIKAEDFAYQVPIQEDTAVNVEVSLISEGQVNDDANSGYVIDHIEGLYKTQLYTESDRVELPATVKWETSKTYYSEYVQMSYDKAKQYINDSRYLSDKYTYVYEVPNYPNTGDAVIKVTDANNKVVAYFLYPTENQWRNADGTIYPTNTTVKNTRDLDGAKYENKNEISLPNKYGVAVKASEEEISNTVGEFTQEGNVAIVDSKVSGRTNLKATITVPGLTTEQLNPTNGSELYTSVQWAPIPESELDEAGDDFYAITAQNITVKAQLYDINGNKVTTKDKKVTFKVDGKEIEESERQTLAANSNVTIQQKDLVSNEKGQATIKFSALSDKGYAHHLSAECEGYKVKLLVGPEEIETELANLYWVKLGLSFTDKVAYTKVVDGKDVDVVSTTSSTLDGKSEVQSINSKGKLVNNVDSRQVGSNWIFGYELVGNIDATNAVTTNKVKAVSNVKVGLSKSDDTDMTMVTDNMPNGAAKVYTEKTGSATIIGTLDNNSFNNETANDVEFTIVDQYDEIVGVYKNVGENAPNISAKLSLNLSWENKGKHVNVVYPDGNTLNVNEDSTAYIQVVDDYGNPLQGEELEYSITGVNEKLNVSGKTDSNGLVKIDLPAPGDNAKDQGSIISAVVDGTTYTGNTIMYRTTTDTEFALVGASLDSTNVEKPEIKLTFSAGVNKNLLNTGMFRVSSNDVANYAIESVRLGDNSNVVILTLKSESKDIVNDNKLVTVTVKPYTEAGITHNMVDINGRYITDNYNSASFMPKKQYTLEATANEDNTQITVVLKDSAGNEIDTTSTQLDKRIYAYSSVASVLPTTGLTYLESGKRTVNVTPIDSATTIYFYYCGASTSVTVKKQAAN